MRNEDPKSYIGPVFLALLLHGAVFAALTWHWPRNVEPHRLAQPKAVQAKVVRQDPVQALKEAQAREEAARQRAMEVAEKERLIAERKREAERQRQAELKRQQELKRQEEARKKRLAEQRRKEAERKRKLAEEKRRQEQARLAEQKRLAEEKKRKEEEARRKREEAEKRRLAEQKRLEEERRKREEEERRRREAEERRLAEQRRQEQLRKQQESAFDNALAAEEEYLQALTDAEKVDAYSAMIKGYVSDNWSRPLSARTGSLRNKQVVLRVTLVPTGEVVGITVISSSGNDAYDRSVEQAIRKAAPFRELSELDSRLFDRKFRELTFEFNPKDLSR